MPIKKAVVEILVVYIRCPHCGEPQVGPEGFNQWSIEFLDDAKHVDTCHKCGDEFEMPTQVEVFGKTDVVFGWRGSPR